MQDDCQYVKDELSHLEFILPPPSPTLQAYLNLPHPLPTMPSHKTPGLPQTHQLSAFCFCLASVCKQYTPARG